MNAKQMMSAVKQRIKCFGDISERPLKNREHTSQPLDRIL